MKTFYSFWIMAIMILPAIAIIQSRNGDQQSPAKAYTLKGKVVTENGQPVPGAHVFVVEGEEEGLSNGKGEFSLKTWNRFPLVLVVKTTGYPVKKINIQKPGDLVQIVLTR
ncbi:MAG: carboxypeptidase-like regulatory domain-containing protein [Chitinophagaceae bacterium]|nr:carboxypeptidase-like regulatory domain-containing protein [Chitinophagaceae bacterium]